MFRGSYDHVLDEKGRTSLPRDFRDTLSGFKGTPVITALRDCLAIYPAEEFEAIEARLSAASSAIDSVQRYQRLFTGMAHPCPFDRQGRILIPQKLRDWAHLERDLVLAGVGRRIEVWDRTRHTADLERTRERYAELTRELKDYDL